MARRGARTAPPQSDCGTSMESSASDVPSPTVEVQLYNSPLPQSAQILDFFDIALDLAVVAIPVAAMPASIPHLPLADATPDTQIHIIGHSAAGPWTVWAGTILNENGPNGDFHRFVTGRDSSLTGGFSGGPVFDSRGALYGMHVCTTGSYGRSVKIREITSALAAWHVPTNNLIAGTVTYLLDREKLKQLLNINYGGLIRLRYASGEGQYLSTAFGLTPDLTTWQMQIGKHNELKGYWIFRMDVRQAWQAENANGPLRYWNADGLARGNPEDYELFLFEIADSAAGTVLLQNVRGRYVRYRAPSFVCDAERGDAAAFTVEFPSVSDQTDLDRTNIAPKLVNLNHYRVGMNGGNPGATQWVLVDFQLFDDGTILAPLTLTNDVAATGFCGTVQMELHDRRDNALIASFTSQSRCIGPKANGGGQVREGPFPWKLTISRDQAERYRNFPSLYIVKNLYSLN